MSHVDSIAQGRVWTGKRAIGIGLIDRTGTLQDALDCAARMAKLTNYRTREYPEQKTWLEQLTGQSYTAESKENAMIKEVGQEQYNLLQNIKQLKQIVGIPQTRLPFTISFN